MRLYAVAESETRWHWTQHLGFEAVTFVVMVILAGFLIGLGEKGFKPAIIAAPFVTLAIFWRSLTGNRKNAVAERGRYYCSACSQHFEGDDLRQITQ
jgi:hypothetical protein